MKGGNDDYRYMARALYLARNGSYTTHPNPRVGCVIVSKNKIVGEGWHVKAGEDHAEIVALKQAGDDAKGAHCYITLEPCAHTGMTPPCTDALIRSGISRVVSAAMDPNPLVAGKGFEILEQHGIATVNGVMEEEATYLNAGFFKRMVSRLPYVRCKLAMSLDGRTALATGESKWITGEQARQDGHHYRALSCAIITGIGTVLADDPNLNVRDIKTQGRQPIRVILDKQLRTPADAKLFHHPGKIIIFTENDDQQHHNELKQNGADVVLTDSTRDLKTILQHLSDKEQVNEILLEAGPILAGSFLGAGLIDELILYQSPTILGDKAKGLFHLPQIKGMNDKITVDLVETRNIGDDIKYIYKLVNTSK